MNLFRYRLAYCLLILILVLTFCAIFSTYSFASDPKFITTINNSLKKIQRMGCKDKYASSRYRRRYRGFNKKV